MARKEKQQKIPARRYAELSFQFYRDGEGTPNFLITSNPQKEGREFCTGVDKWLFTHWMPLPEPPKEDE